LPVRDPVDSVGSFDFELHRVGDEHSSRCNAGALQWRVDQNFTGVGPGFIGLVTGRKRVKGELDGRVCRNWIVDVDARMVALDSLRKGEARMSSAECRREERERARPCAVRIANYDRGAHAECERKGSLRGVRSAGDGGKVVGHQTLHHGAESDDSNKDAKQGERHAGEVGGDRGDRQDGRTRTMVSRSRLKRSPGMKEKGLKPASASRAHCAMKMGR